MEINSSLLNEKPSSRNQCTTPIFVLEDFTPESSKIASQFICMLCKDICFEPFNIPNGDCFICKKCYNIYEKDQNAFPQLSQILQDQKPLKIDSLVRVIYNLKVKCKNRDKGCTSQGTVQCIQTHMNNECEYQDIQCPNLGCQEIFIRQQLKEHLIKCDFRNEICNDCKLSFPFRHLEQHSTVCPKLKIKCSQGCGETILRENESEHFEHKCVKTEITCPFNTIGCDLKMLRGNLNEHLEKENQYHLLSFFEDFKKFRENIGIKINERLNKTVDNLPGIIQEMFEKKFELFVIQTKKDMKSTLAKKSTSDISSKLTEKKRKRSLDDISYFEEDLLKSRDIIHELNPNNTNNIEELFQNTNVNNFNNNNSQQENINQIEHNSDVDLMPIENINTIPNKQSPSPTLILHPVPQRTPETNQSPSKDTPINDLPNKTNNNNSNNSPSEVTDIPPSKVTNCYFSKHNLNVGITQSGKIIKTSLPINNRTHEYCFSDYKIDPSVKGMFTEWEFEVHVKTSFWIGFGLCDQQQVEENGKVFHKKKESNFSNGTFGLSSNCYTWNCNNKNENNFKLNGMKAIKDNETISLRYNNDKQELWFRLQIQEYEVKLTEVYPKKSNKLTICILFLNGENQIELRYLRNGKMN
jgi:hypothetical protein